MISQTTFKRRPEWSFYLSEDNIQALTKEINKNSRDYMFKSDAHTNIYLPTINIYLYSVLGPICFETALC